MATSGIVPIIDVAPFLEGDSAARAAVAKELVDAAKDVGFFFIKGYQKSIQQETVEKAFAKVSATVCVRAGPVARGSWAGSCGGARAAEARPLRLGTSSYRKADSRVVCAERRVLCAPAREEGRACLGDGCE